MVIKSKYFLKTEFIKFSDPYSEIDVVLRNVRSHAESIHTFSAQCLFLQLEKDTVTQRTTPNSMESFIAVISL